MGYIPQKELQNRRDALAQHLPEGAIVVLFSAEVQYRNADIEHTFRQASERGPLAPPVVD
ncbi:MAG: aminopeptidase P N-terminal domain-containing protein, partial [Candidatus Paceibacteria bacterium]